MWIIVDGYNLIRQSPTLQGLDRQDLEAGRQALLDRLRAYRLRRGHRITVVFDGKVGLPASETAGAGVAVIYSKGESADDVIRRLAAGVGAGGIIVTSDRELGRAAARMGVAVVSAPEFEARMARAEMADLKGTDDEEADVPRRPKGEAHRPSKGERQRRAALKRL